MTTNRCPHAPYIQAVIDAMTTTPLPPGPATSVEPDDWWISDAETGTDGETCTLNAVITWDGDTAPDRWPHGLLLLWDLEREWQYAGMRPDGSNDWPTDLSLSLWAHPQNVADAALALLTGVAPFVPRPEWDDPDVKAAVTVWVES